MPYIVKSKRKSNGEIIVSQAYKTKSEAQKHAQNTRKFWKNMYSNPRVKKV